MISAVAFVFNLTVTQYPGNNYFPLKALYTGVIVFLIYLGCRIQFGKNSIWTSRLKTMLHCLAVFYILLFTTNAIQFTPFNPIDQSLLPIEQFFRIDMIQLLTWTEQHPIFQAIFESAYRSLTYQLVYIPIFLILTGYHQRIQEFLFLILTTGLMGFTFYYFFPTTAPASIISSPLFGEMQQATGLKFYQIHHYIQPSTYEGGMISLPSFHVIWAWLSIYLVRDWMIPCILLSITNLILVLSCIFLGWHYLIDIIISVVIIMIGHFFYAFEKHRHNPTIYF